VPAAVPIVGSGLDLCRAGRVAGGLAADLRAAIAAGVDHVSTYGLTFEKGAAFWGRRQRGQLNPVDEELERAMYEAAIDTLIQAGFEHYEVSNFARPATAAATTRRIGGERAISPWAPAQPAMWTAGEKRIIAARPPT